MKNCNARIGTYTVTGEVVAEIQSWSKAITPDVVVGEFPDGMAVQRQGDCLVRVTLHALTCDSTHTGSTHRSDDGDAYWSDHTPGAVPHTDDVTVSDAELQAAQHAYMRADQKHAHTMPELPRLRAALLAAKRASKEQS